MPITINPQKNKVDLKVKVIADEKVKVATDLKTSKLFLFAPVVEGRDQNYNNLHRGVDKKFFSSQ